jgi:uncharacterized protein YdeI (YjbR/CyaY-like superfamily)
MNKGNQASAPAVAAGTSKKVEGFMRVPRPWLEEMRALRAMALEFPLVEDLKWRWPCYSLDGGNVILIHAFKEYCAFLFFKGALLKDPKRILETPGSLQSGRQFRFRSLKEIADQERTVKSYIREAIAVEASGMRVEKKKTSDYPVAPEFKAKLDKLPKVKAAFEALTPGRQRAYLFHFSGAKQSKTRAERVEKCLPLILQGKGLTD